MSIPSNFLSRWLTGVGLAALLAALGGAAPAWAQAGGQPGAEEAQKEPAKTEEEKAAEAAAAAAAAEAAEEAFSEVIEVTGFRQALEESVALKRDAVNVRDSIIAEDIGKMPELNLAEAIQRVPGVAITREGGEGRQISLRGLDPSFTQVTLNGMEAPSSTGGLDSFGGINRGRSFDFNVFPSEIFSRIDINKSILPSIEEGGVAGSVEMYTGRPLSHPGLHGSLQVQGGYNDLSEESDPRLSATVSTTNKSGTLGFIVTAAMMGRTSWQDGFGTVRWAQPDRPFRGNETDISTSQLNTLWYPRLPRQDSFRHEEDRSGLASTLQWKPTDRFDLSLNYVYSKFDHDTNSYNSFAQFRRIGTWGYPTITPTDVTVTQNGDGQIASAGTFRGVSLRTESRQNEDTTEFNQLTTDFKWEIDDTMTLSGMVGRAKSDFEDLYFRVNIETQNTSRIFSYDFTSNPDIAAIRYNFDVTDPSQYAIVNDELFQRNLVDRTNDTARLDYEWLFGVGHSLKAGAIYNNREVDSLQFIQDINPAGTQLSAIGEVFRYVDVGNYGGNTTLDFLVLDFDRAKDAFGFGNFAPFRGPGRATWNVNEETAGVYGEYNLVSEIQGHGLRMSLGARYVETEIEATGWLSSTLSNTETNSYDNVLPALSVAFDATPELVLRLGVSQTMTRPALDSLAPTKAYSNVNFTVTGGNSQLDPLVSDNYDLGVEWYFTEDAVLGVAYFHKDIDSFISSPTTQEPLRQEDYAAVRAVYPNQPALLDPSLIWTYSTSANTEGTKLDGLEFAYQQAFHGLPGFWSNFGFIGNYTWVDAETQVTRSGTQVTVPLQGLSRNSWNGTLYYETPRWGARASVNNRDDYVTNNLGANGNISEATSGPVRWDLSAFWHINDSFTFTLEGINLTDEEERLYTTGDGSMNLVREINFSGRQLFLGLRWNF